jgi:ATP-dependent DNA helicase PIF1
MRGRNRAESERSSIGQENTLLLAMGDGALPNPYYEENPHLVRLPSIMCMSVTDDEAGMSKIVREVYVYLLEPNDDPDFLADRAILCPLNTQVDRVKKYCLEHIPGEIVSLYSTDKAVNSDEQARDLYPVEYINSLKASGIPCHLLHLKKGCIVMRFRNVRPEAGCYNGTSMIVNDVVNNKILRCTIINGSNAGEEISIPRIKLRPQDLTNQPYEWEILQFPVRLAYAMAINKSQGQTLAKVGVWLVTAVFGGEADFNGNVVSIIHCPTI